MISRVLRDIRTTALAENIMDVNVCGAITPYNEILGGKLVASLMASQESENYFESVIILSISHPQSLPLLIKVSLFSGCQFIMFDNDKFIWSARANTIELNFLKIIILI